jgi:hypothetical protein
MSRLVLVDAIALLDEALSLPQDQARRLIRDTASRADRDSVRHALQFLQNDSRSEGLRWLEAEFELAFASSVSMNERLIAFAAAILPARSRSRYREEFDGELAEIAAECVRIRQIRYCLRLLVRAVSLRRELRKPAAERAR